MKPVMQTRFGYPDGNCFAACVASILELAIDEVPQVSAAGEGWYDEWQTWLRARGLQMFTWPVYDGEGNSNYVPAGYAILGTVPPNVDRGDAPEGFEVGHAVVAYEGDAVHDPHPFDELGRWTVWTSFLALDPARMARTEQLEDQAA